MKTPPIENKERFYPETVVYSDEDGCYVASSPSWPYVGAHGATEEEALREMRAAIAESLAVASRHGDPAPTLTLC